MRSGVFVLVAACGGSGGPIAGAPGPYFTNAMFWNRDVSGAAKAGNSDQIIGSLRAAGGWGNNDRLQVDFSFDVLAADATTPQMTFTPTADFYTPDCDHVAVPVPPGGN